MKNFQRSLLWGILSIFCLRPLLAQAPPYQFKLVNGNDTTVKFGFLAQPQFESLENPSEDDYDSTVFFRRLRLMAGGDITGKLSFFLESDSPNLGKELADGTRADEIFLQDAYVNYAFHPEFQVSGGMILMPLSRNSGQSAGSLLAIDYGPYSFLSSGLTRSKVGRDYGVMARGYINNHFEYRAGIFRGNRNHDGDYPYRTLLRVVYYPFEADTGFFYSGPSFGQKRIIGIGASIDRQGSYSANSVDVFIDQPLGNGDAFTVRADFIRYDQQSAFKDQSSSMPATNAWLLEGNYYFSRAKLAPFFQFASRDPAGDAAADCTKIQAGIAYYSLKNRLNIKAGFGRLLETGKPDRNQFVIQTQLLYF
ncbi:MAG: hypothetical protein JW793_14005 [Acidobacteria bacterium]|nr:hypothetical protein [Acidobacteriota bacterium]